VLQLLTGSSLAEETADVRHEARRLFAVALNAIVSQPIVVRKEKKLPPLPFTSVSQA